MAIEVTTWNALDAYSEEASARQLIGRMIEFNPDVAAFPEAYQEGREDWLDNVHEDYDAAGYTVIHGLYDDEDGRSDRHGLLTIAKTELLDTMNSGLIRLTGRNAISLSLLDEETDEAVNFVGVHLDDRLESTRLAQVDSLINQLPVGPVAIGGDYNAMHRSDVIARALRFVRPATELLPVAEPTIEKTESRLGRIGSLATRLTEMARGTTLQKIEMAGFEDADARHKPTITSTRPIAQLDHIMVGRGLVAIGHQVRPHHPVSDHRAISATLRLSA